MDFLDTPGLNIAQKSGGMGWNHPNKVGAGATIFKYRKHVFLERSVVGSDFVEVCGCLSRFLSLLTNSSPSTPCCELVYVLRLRCGLAIDLIKLGLRCC